MAIKKNAKKAHRSSLRKHAFNLRRMNALREAMKNVRSARAAGTLSDAPALLSRAYQEIDKAAKRGVIKKNNAARKKSRLARSLANLGA